MPQYIYPDDFEGTFWTVVDGAYYVSTIGNDIMGDGSPKNPFLTVEKAFDLALDGEKIIIGPDEYVSYRPQDPQPSGAHLPCRLAAHSNIIIGTGGGGLQVIDGVQTVAGDRILLFQQADPKENGIYEATTGTWSRTEDFENEEALITGKIIPITEGTLHGEAIFQHVTSVSITLGITPIVIRKIEQLRWGNIQGALSDQLDLQVLLDAKAAASDLTAHVTDGSNPHSVTQAQVGLSNVDNTSDLNKPVSTAQQTALDVKADKANVLEKDNTVAFSPSADHHPATKKFVEDQIATLDKATPKGMLDASSNPNYPTGVTGDYYYVSSNGKVGGASGEAVEIGDKIQCIANNGGGTQAAVGSSWIVFQGNLDKATTSDVQAGANDEKYLTSKKGYDGWYSWLNNKLVSELATNDQTVVGAINELSLISGFDGLYAVEDASTNSSIEIASFNRATSGVAVSGIGGFIAVGIEDGSQSTKPLLIEHLLTDVSTSSDSLFRIRGQVNGALQDLMAINGSTAITGYGDTSISLGWNADASAFRSVAIGQSASSTGGNSVAIGLNSSAAGVQSIGAGNNAAATGSASVALGDTVKANGTSSVAIGNWADAVGSGSVAVGRGIEAFASRSIIMGYHDSVTPIVQQNAIQDSFKLMWGGVTAFHAGASLGTQVTVNTDPDLNLTDAANGVIAYDATDHEFRAFINGSWQSFGVNTNNYLSGASFASGTGILTLSRSGLPALTVDLDGRYLTGNQNISLGGQLSGSGTTSISASLTAAAITAQAALTGGLAATDELLVSDAGVLKRMDVSVLQSFLQNSLAFAQVSHNHSASNITSGTLANARISQGNVTQHQTALSIGWNQLTGIPSYLPSSGGIITGGLTIQGELRLNAVGLSFGFGGDSYEMTVGDDNPTWNGASAGATVNWRGDNINYNLGHYADFFQAAHHVQAASGFYVGAVAASGTQVIDSARNIYAGSGSFGGNITWDTTGLGPSWSMNTDGAYIRFFNTGDADTNSRLEYAVFDNNNEFHRWLISGVDVMNLRSNALNVNVDLYVPDQIIHTGDTDTYMQFHGANLWRVVAAGVEQLEIGNSYLEIPNLIRHTGDTDTYMQFNAANSWRVVTGNAQRVLVNSSGLTVSGEVYIPNQIVHSGDTDTYIQFHAANQWRVVTGGAERLEVNNSEIFVSRPIRLNGYNLRRSNHYSGHLEGSYNNVGENSTKSNPIYTIGSNYNPTDAALGNMYGIGYTHTNATFVSTNAGSGWGMYVASDGDARIFLNGSNGSAWFSNSVYCQYVNLGAARISDNANRAGLLKIEKTGTQTWAGISIEHSTTSAWSVMGDQDDFGLYDDYNNKWALLYNENSNLELYFNGAVKLRTASGGITVTGTGTATDWIATSDEKLKTNIRPFGRVLDKIAALKGSLSTYSWLGNGEEDVGYTAQRVQAQFPDFVQGDELLGVSYGKLSAVALEGVAEVNEELVRLREEVKELRKILAKS